MSANWLDRQHIEMSDFGRLVADLLGELFEGIYHVGNQALKADWSQPKFVSIIVYDARFATYDSDLLTRLVILAHNRNVRISIKAAAPRYLRLEFMPVTRAGFFADRHPTLQESIDKCSAPYNVPTTKSSLPEWVQEALARAKASPELLTYVTADSLTEGKGAVVPNKLPTLKQAWAAADFIETARGDVIQLCALLESSLFLLSIDKPDTGNTEQ